ncbi:MAG: hypothetical protein QOD06_2077 [Candidatus Binatota bacterium]|jgi:hypothetical protein|nr:hypothetical protein [Candidatus Binatota bacterium]
MDASRMNDLHRVVARIGYLADDHGPVHYRVYPPSSGRPVETPPKRYHEMPILDCRPVAGELSLDVEGFALRRHASIVGDFYDDDLVRREYYPEVERLMREATGALAVFAFDHNVRSAQGAAEGRAGIRQPVDMAHNDYTEASGPRRVREILAERGRDDLGGHQAALVNAWRPTRGPVQDIPLTVCEARSTSAADFVETSIEHFGEEDLAHARHSGAIYSFRHSTGHRWFYVSNMEPDEVLLLKCFDSRRDGRARYTAHTGFANPDSPPEAVPRESIEVRTLVVFPE